MRGLFEVLSLGRSGGHRRGRLVLDGARDAGYKVKPAHLAFFVGRPRRGGAERVMLTLASEFARRGCRVDLVFARRDGPLLAEVPRSLRIVELGVPGMASSLPALLRLPSSAWRVALHPSNPKLMRCTGRLADYLREGRPDALLSTLRSENLTAIWASMLAGTGTRVVVREANLQSLQSSSERTPLKRDFPAIARQWFPRAHRTVAVSKSAADDLVNETGIPRASVSTIYNPFEIERLQSLAAEPLDDPWFRPKAPPVCVTAARLVPQKDHTTLLRAFELLLRKREARLLVLGEGPERGALEEYASKLRISEHVRFLGSVANPSAYFARAGVFVLSSAWEGFPNVLVEALACGCPIVSTDCPGGASEILEGGDFGRLVPVGDADAMSSALDAALRAPRDFKRLRERAEHFSLDRAVEAYARLLLPLAEADRYTA